MCLTLAINKRFAREINGLIIFMASRYTMLFRRLLISFLIAAIISVAHAQTAVIEKLKDRIAKAASAEEKINYIFRLCEEKQSMSTEAHRYYVTLATNIARTLHNGFYEDKASAENVFLLAKDEKTDTALSIVNALLKKYERTGNRDFITELLVLKGRVLDRGFRRFDMINANLSMLQECERHKDTLCLLMTMNSMGWGYLELGKNEEALSWLKKALQLNYSDTTALKNYNCLYSNTALAFYHLGRQDSAEYYIDMAIKYGREAETLTFLANALSFRAQILMQAAPSVARASLDEALEIRKKIGDPYYILYNLLELAGFYAFEKNYTKSIALCNEGVTVAYHSGLTTKLPELYKLLADDYEATGRHVESIHILHKLISVTDSLNNVFTASLSDIKAKYEVQQKDNVIMRQRFDLTTKNYFLFGSLLLLLVVVLAAYFVFRANMRRHKMKMQLMRDEEKRKALQAVSEAEEAERRRIAADLHDNLGAQANAILYSAELLQQENTVKEVVINNLHDTARDMLASLRETLWALKTVEVEASDVWMRLINFTKQLGRHYSSVKISAEGVIPSLRLPSTRALNIIFIMQEALNNAVRHSEGDTILVTSEYAGKVWKLEIKDNGKGFDSAAAGEKPESYGLSNMLERAKAAGALMRINISGTNGSIIELTVPDEH